MAHSYVITVFYYLIYDLLYLNIYIMFTFTSCAYIALRTLTLIIQSITTNYYSINLFKCHVRILFIAVINSPNNNPN